ncbi:MAG: T9SS type A sorting domain-containing protein [Flavobacteriaceae bacterium]|nr:T9SS type A sorting domain-containing protein [Flavobacteriaceae bacterium]
MYSQERVLASGGDISGSNGSANYSVGQIIQNVVSSPSGSVFQGIQFFFPSATLSVIDLETNMEVIAYPNPTSSVFNIQLHDNATHEMKYELYNLLGQSVLNGNILGNSAAIDVSHLPNAVYLLRISNQNNRIFKTFKLIKN